MIEVLGDGYRCGCHLGFCDDGAETLAQFQMLNSFRHRVYENMHHGVSMMLRS